eukprot:TRINITY_DN4320_c1_g1_i3.p1 TRINITY_DN4320_c1_g1~~TRINITY_DN4320_c1_g1_i3.p1  ORF type:complete len:346 (-),score=43.58 TRINITY_DN4320_c1_g1_i3:326-1336(-)
MEEALKDQWLEAATFKDEMHMYVDPDEEELIDPFEDAEGTENDQDWDLPHDPYEDLQDELDEELGEIYTDNYWFYDSWAFQPHFMDPREEPHNPYIIKPDGSMVLPKELRDALEEDPDFNPMESDFDEEFEPTPRRTAVGGFLPPAITSSTETTTPGTPSAPRESSARFVPVVPDRPRPPAAGKDGKEVDEFEEFDDEDEIASTLPAQADKVAAKAPSTTSPSGQARPAGAPTGPKPGFSRPAFARPPPPPRPSSSSSSSSPASARPAGAPTGPKPGFSRPAFARPPPPPRPSSSSSSSSPASARPAASAPSGGSARPPAQPTRIIPKPPSSEAKP